MRGEAPSPSVHETFNLKCCSRGLAPGDRDSSDSADGVKLYTRHTDMLLFEQVSLGPKDFHASRLQPERIGFRAGYKINVGLNLNLIASSLDVSLKTSVVTTSSSSMKKDVEL